MPVLSACSFLLWSVALHCLQPLSPMVSWLGFSKNKQSFPANLQAGPLGKLCDKPPQLNSMMAAMRV
jgi:hypothetical protein